MQEILKNYRERLINLSGRNRSLVLRKLYKKRSFDIHRLMEISEIDMEAFVSFLLGREGKSFKILEDPFKLRQQKIRALNRQVKEDEEKELSSLKVQIEKMSPLSESERAVFDKREDEIHRKYELFATEERERIEAMTQKVIRYANELNYLIREIQSVEKETGKYELFLGYPFVEGRFNDGTPVRGPLLLIPVTALKKNNEWYLANIKEQDILINKVLVYGYAKYNNVKLTDFETEFSTLEDFGDQPLDGVLTYVNEHQLITEEMTQDEILKFRDYTNEDFKMFDPGKLQVKPYMILGQFPLSNSIYTDYQHLEKVDIDHDLLSALLINEDKDVLDRLDEDKKTETEELLSEHDTYFMTQLDYSQENAVAKLSSHDKLVIYGPPGTGKSHTIANIISDGLAKNKKVLMVSQKRAALDVIYNRLSDIKHKMVLIHDANKDKKSFYEKVTQALEPDALTYEMTTRMEHDALATEIDEKVEGLQVIGEMLMKKRPFGISLQEMYVKTKGIFEISDPRFETYKQFRKTNPFGNYVYQELDSAIKHLLNKQEVIQDFFIYKNKVVENPWIEGFAHKMDLMAYDEIVTLSKSLYGLMDDVKDGAEESYRFFGKMWYEHPDGVYVNQIKEAAQAYNHELNGHLLNLENENGVFGKLAHLKEIKHNRNTYEQQQARYIELFKGYKDMLTMAESMIEPLKTHLTSSSFDRFHRGLVLDFFNQSRMNELINALEEQEAFLPYKTKAQSLSTLQGRILEYLYEQAGGSESEAGKWLSRLMEMIILEQISEIEKSEEFNEFYLHFNLYNEHVELITDAMAKKNALTRSIVTSHWSDQFQLFVDTADYKEFKRQAGKKRQLWPIRKYVDTFSEMLLTLFPCWLLSPETVSDIFPLKEGMFDLIIFDEASQIFVESAVPTIFRGKRVVIAGDDQQLRPTSLFMTRYDEVEEEEMTTKSAAALEEESLLDLAKVNYQGVHLNYHYRSRYEELINFSNYAFYQGRLNIAPNIVSNTAAGHPPITRIKVAGIWEERRNQEEANEVVELIAKTLKERKSQETIGVITFNITQKDLIEDLLEARTQYDEEFAELYRIECQRLDGNEDVSLFVKNIENVQGDERDIIIFSVGYAPNREGRVSVNFGALSQDGGENRLNVAISRAKHQIYLITSIEPSELKVEDTQNRGPKLFKEYLQYAKSVSDDSQSLMTQTLSGLSELKREKVIAEDEFVLKLKEALTDRGFDVHLNIGSSQSKIDLAILHPRTHAFILGIECDGKTYRSISSVRERDVHRKRFLESRGWEIMRVWSVDWWKDPEKVLSEIQHFVEVLIEGEMVTESDTDQSISGEIDQDLESAVFVEGNVWFGHKVFVKDTMTSEIFDINMEAVTEKHKMNAFKKVLLGMPIGSIFEYQGYEYQITKIR